MRVPCAYELAAEVCISPQPCARASLAFAGERGPDNNTFRMVDRLLLAFEDNANLPNP
jgi:hypothetical protein